MHCNFILHYVIFGSPMHTLDHAELESEVQAEQAQVQDPTNQDWIKASLGASHHCP
jgi:hypothetical protein